MFGSPAIDHPCLEGGCFHRSEGGPIAQLRHLLRGKDPQERRNKRAKITQDLIPMLRFKGQTMLESFAVSPQTALDYYRRGVISHNFCQLQGLKDTSPGHVDQALAIFPN